VLWVYNEHIYIIYMRVYRCELEGDSFGFFFGEAIDGLEVFSSEPRSTHAHDLLSFSRSAAPMVSRASCSLLVRRKWSCALKPSFSRS